MTCPFDCLRLYINTAPNHDSDQDPLENHTATVLEYLSSYQTLTKEDKMDDRTSSFYNMMKYLVSRCWEKMNRRMFQWQSKGFIHNLTSIDNERFMSDSAQYMSSIGPPKRMDTALTKAIVDLHASIIDKTLTNSVFPLQGFPKLAAACRRVQESERRDQERVYSQDNCVEFHVLLVSVLKGYCDALDNWNKSKKKFSLGMQTQDEYIKLRLQYAVNVYNFGHLLWRIAYSQALRDHLGMLVAHSQLATPTYAGYQRGEYRTSASSEDSGGHAARDEDEEAHELQELITRGGISLVYQRWIQLQVTQWAALDILSSYSRHATNSLQSIDMSICLLSTTRQNHGSLDDWRTVIEKLVNQPPATFIPSASISDLDAKLVIGVMETKIIYFARRKSNSIFFQFTDNETTGLVVHHHAIDLIGQRHCEAVLACLRKYLDRLLSPQHPAYQVIKV